ncbi:transcobalamin-2 [Alosa sapidissima]|uniref:transcobalamin-2 n=1 Tax=Alosa sapidissima TaxID=34773 RepID=UPI001C08A178|nr:transcobalamin-2 [Alosa sapidissima]
MNVIFCIVSALVVLATAKPCAQDHDKLLLSLNKQLLRSVEDKDSLPNPSVHLALRLSTTHNLNKETEHLDNLKTKLHNDIESSLSKGQAVLGRLALYILALKSSCHDVNSLTFSVNQKSDSLLTHLKKQMENEKEHIAFSQRPLTNYYQYSLGILTLCLSGVRVNPHVSNKLIHAVERGLIKHGDSLCIDTYAMAGMALQCLKNAGSHVMDATQLEKALDTIKQRLLSSKRADGHMGNEFSTGLAVQALLAMGSDMQACAASMEALREDVRKGTYGNPMAMSQTLPALQQRSYLSLKGKECRNEDDTLVLDTTSPVIVLPSQTTIHLQVEVVKSDNMASTYSVDVPKGSSLLEALTLLQGNQAGFTFEKESSLWGPFLSSVNGEQARQSDRRYWRLSSNGKALGQGVTDYKVEAAQKITIKNSSF